MKYVSTLSKISFCTFFVILFQIGNSYASCNAVDLRSSTIAPVRSQFFKDENGALHESQACQSFAAANLVGQVAGVAISAEDIYFNSMFIEGKGYGELTGDEFAIDHVFFDGGGDSDEVIKSTTSKGFCRKQQMDDYILANGSDKQPLDFLYLKSFTNKFTILDLVNETDLACKNRIQLNNITATREDMNVPPNSSVDRLKKARIDRVDNLLDKGKMIAYAHNGHIVTIVGRNESCEYIIQDSIPQDRWELNKTFSRIKFKDGIQQIHFENGFQFWSKDALLDNMVSIAFIAR